MENKHVGYLVLGMSVVITAIIFLFNNAMRRIITDGCPAVHNGLACPAYTTIAQQTYLSLAIVGVLLIVGLVLVFSKPSTRIIVRKVNGKEKKTEIDISEFGHDERKVLSLLQESKAMFQADIVDKTGFAKVKVTRILDKLESNRIIERKRRGMHNLIVLR